MAPTAAMQRKAIRLPAILITVWTLRRLRLRLAASDERGQAGIHVARLGLRHARHERLRIRRNVGLRLRTKSLIRDERLRVVSAILKLIFVARLELLVVAAAA